MKTLSIPWQKNEVRLFIRWFQFLTLTLAKPSFHMFSISIIIEILLKIHKNKLKLCVINLFLSHFFPIIWNEICLFTNWFQLLTLILAKSARPMFSIEILCKKSFLVPFFSYYLFVLKFYRHEWNVLNS